MRIVNSKIRWIFAVIASAALVAGFSLCSTQAEAQTCAAPKLGNNTIYATCSSSITTVGSSAFIDASVFGTAGTGTDVCTRINTALTTSYPSIGAVVDARGINSTNSSMNCSVNPWSGVSAPSTVLLPAGTITITSSSAAWILPGQTKVIGEINNETGNIGSTLKAGASGLSVIIQFCTAACSGVSVEQLILDGNELSVPGISNQYASDLSYVDHVTFTHFQGTGTSAALYVAAGTDTQGSGPYSNLTCQPYALGECVDMEASSTHGVHGMTCVCKEGSSCGGGTNSTDPLACIRLNGSGNTVEDLHVEGFYDGVAVGTESDVNVYGNTLININAADGAGPVENLIQICGSFSSGAPCTSPSTIGDLSIFGLLTEHTNGGGGITNTLKDDVTDTIFLGPTITNMTPVTVAMYALGDAVTNAGISRFTTSSYSPVATATTVAPTWFSGSNAPTTASGGCPVGSLYSNQSNSGTADNTLWVCVGPAASSSWANIK